MLSMYNVTIGDYVRHKTLKLYNNKLKVIAINYTVYTLEDAIGIVSYHQYDDLEPWTPDEILTDSESLYCTCSYSDREIVKSSIQVQGTVEEKDKFKYCRTCKKEAK